MFRLAPLALVPLLGLTGCLGLDTVREPLPLVNSASAVARPMQPERQVSSSPAMKESSERVVQVGQRLILANPQIGLRPLFITVGVPHPEIFHKGGSLGGCQVIVSEGMVRLCPSDAELAAVLALELGKIVSERVALTSPAARQGNDRPPPSESIGSDSGGTFGSSDGTRMMELAQYEARRRERAAKSGPPEPKALAQMYLAKAGYEPATLDKLQPLLRRAEDHFEMEKSIGLTVLPPPPPSSPAVSAPAR
jgi:predicted Zn-dependent protease